MSMDSLTKEWSRLSLSEQEGNMFDFDNKNIKPGSMLAARFFTKRALSVEVVARTFRPLWKTKQEFRIKDLGNHLILFTFEDELDAEKILLGAPWSFDKYLVALCRYETDQSLKELRFDKAEFWVQVHDLPARRMTIEAAEGICKPLGRLSHCCDEEEIDGGNFMRVRVELDITKPLSRGRRVRFGPDSDGWVSFRYERLPVFCYWCGILTHDAKECDIWLRSKGTLRTQQQPFGDWLRATPTSISKRKVISVAGQETRRKGSEANQNIQEEAATTVTERVSVMTRTETMSVSEGTKSKEYSETTDKAKITEILTDSEKFQAHLQEIDDDLLKSPDISSVTNDNNVERDHRTKSSADNPLTVLRHDGMEVEALLDQSPQHMGSLGSGPINMGLSSNGPITNNPPPRTWKRILPGPKITNSPSEDTHAGSKRGAHTHANTDLVSTSKKKKTETEVVEMSKLLAMEFTETAVAARQHRRDQ